MSNENSDDSNIPTTRYKRFFEVKDGFCMLPTFWEVEKEVKAFDVKQGDVWINTFIKSGTTWTQELVWLITHDLDYEGAKTLLEYRSPTFEACWAYKYLGLKAPMPFKELEKNASLSGGRRVIKTHLHWRFLPEKLTRTDSPAKIIYVARNPKDVCVSYYHYLACMEDFRESHTTMDEFCEIFMSEKFFLAPYWNHVITMWARRNEPNILFIKYEDMKKNLTEVVKEVATFLEVPVPTHGDMEKLVKHLSFQSMKENPAVNKPGLFKNNQQSNFIRKGIVGDWKEKIAPQRAKEFDEWIKENTKDTGLTFQDSL